MLIKPITLFLFICIIFFSMPVPAQQSSFPSHCTSAETVFLSAKMKRINRSASATTYTDTGKVVSLCADRAKDPISKLTYRFGPIGKVELEHVATAANKLGETSIQSAPRVSEDIFFFNKGNFTYYINVAGGMGSGVSLIVYQDKKKIVDLFSGNDSDTDFQMPSSLKATAVMTPRVLPVHYRE